MTEDKKPITNLKSVLNSNELEAFESAQRTWEELTKESAGILESMSNIGHAIEMLYDKGKKKGLKKPEITKMVDKSFPGLTAIERSELRKLSRNIDHITCFVRDCGVKSTNTSYLISSYVKAVKEDCQSCEDIEKEIEKELTSVDDVGVDDVGVDDVGVDDVGVDDVGVDDDAGVSTKTRVILGDTITKEGFDNIIRPVEPKDIVENFGKVVNQLKTLCNQGKLTIDDKIEIDRHATTLLAHMAGIDASSSEFDKIAI